ncbi:MAG: CheR family methyltransferase [Acidobacteriota bacterium]
MSPLPDEDLRRLRAWITRSWGLAAGEYRASFLERRLAPRLRATGISSLQAYLAHADAHPAEARAFLGKLLVPTTEFFRNPEVFDRLQSLLAVRAGRPGWETLRLLSAPSSTGEETYSLAALMEERGIRGRILAADRSRASLRTLSRGEYPLRTLRTLNRERFSRYFRAEEDAVSVAPALRRRVVAVCADLTQGLPGRGFHAVVMRNLFIYLTEEAQARLLREVHGALVPGGLLVLGRVEAPARACSGMFAVLDREARIYERAGRAE